MRRFFSGPPAFCWWCLAWAGFSSGVQANVGPPAITAQPQSLAVTSGATATFTVQASGALPLSYRWRFNGAVLAGATNSSLTYSSVVMTNGGAYSVVVTNSFGAVTSAVALLTVDPDLVFRLIALETNAAVAIEHEPQTGDDRGGIAVSTTSVFVTGDESTGRFPLDTLSGGTRLGRIYDALVSNLHTETVYTLGNGTEPIRYTNSTDTLNFTTVNSLIEINGQTGQPTGQRINLTSNISISVRNVGIFAGYDRVVLWNGSRAYSIGLPSGAVTDLGAMPFFNHTGSESWAFWGIAEYTGSAINLVYVQNSQNIVRTRVPDRPTTTLLNLTNNFAFSDMASITFSISRSRWFFHHEGTSIFRSGDETVGSAKASYTTDAGYPSLVVEPQDMVSFPSSNVTFTAIASGAEPLLYQWHSNGVPIAGATTPTLTLTNLGTNTGALYRVDVSNPVGLARSRSARLTIYSIPQIASHPQSRGVLPGTNVFFFVNANAAPPVSYHWRKNGAPFASPGNSSLLVTNIQPADAGFYSVVVSNRFGTALSSNAELYVLTPVDDGSVFQVTSLTTNGANTVDVYQTPLEFNFSYGPLAVSADNVIYSSFDQSARNRADNLSGGVLNSRFYPAMASNLRTEQVYALGTATGPFADYNGGTLTALWEVNGTNGTLTTTRILLSSAIPFPDFDTSRVGIFAGYDRIVVAISGSRAYSIELPSGAVTDLGPLPFINHAFSFGGGFWGIAEQFGGVSYLLYPQNFQNIVRTRLPDGVTTVVATFPDLNSYFSSISASVRRGRWYFSYLFGNSTFGPFNAGLGYANATFSVNSGPKADHFEWGPLPAVQVLNTPFNVTLTAKNTTNATIANYQGRVTLSGLNLPGQTAVPISPTVISNFVNGIWTGQLTVSGGTTGMVLRAFDPATGIVGISETFSVNPSNDLILSIRDLPDPFAVNGTVTYVLSLTNTGPAAATSVFLTNSLPTNGTLVSFTVSQGSCAPAGGVLLCDLGTVANGTSPRLTVEMSATNETTLTYRATVSRAEIDPAPGNNSVIETTVVQLPALSVNDVSIVEGNSGTNDLVFSVRLSPPSTNLVTVAFSALGSTATPNGPLADFLATNGTLTFPPLVTNQSVAVRVRSDVLYEANETLLLLLSAPVNAGIARNVGTGTIINDDAAPFVSITNIMVTEGNAGPVTATIQVRLSAQSGLPVTVAYSTFDGTATSGEDYTNVSGVVAFSGGTPTLFRNINVPIRGDTNIEPNEFFYVQLLSATNAIVDNAVGACTIVNDDGGGILHHFSWAPVPSPQPADVPFPVAITAEDVFNRAVTNFAGPLQLSGAATGAETSRDIFGEEPFTNSFTGAYTLGYNFTPKQDLTVTHFRHYTGIRVSLWSEDGTLLGTEAVGSSSGSWVETPLSQPISLKGGTTYVLGYYTGGANEPYYFRDDPTLDFTDVALIEGRFGSGDVFPGLNAGLPGWAVDIRYLVGGPAVPVSITPTNATGFVQGVWTGMLTVRTNSTNITLTATDTAQRSGRSARFNTVSDSNSDLQISLSVSTTNVALGSNLTYVVTVENHGPLGAIDVTTTNQLPAGFNFVSAASSQGSVTNVGGEVRAQLGGLSQGAQATVTIRARADVAGWNTNQAQVAGSRPDPVSNNNRAVVAAFVFRDTDGDGIGDDWEQFYGLDPSDPTDGALDSDGDTHSNYTEFLAGTNPLDANSALRIVSIEALPAGARLIFRGVRGGVYRFESKDGLDGSWKLILVFQISPNPLANEAVWLNDPAPPTRPVRVYRVQAVLP